MAISFIVKISGIVGSIILVLFLSLTSPTEIGPLGVLVFFTTLYIVIFSVFSLVWQAFSRFAYKRSVMRRKDYLCSAVLAFGPIMLLMARSFGAISIWTIGLIALFLILAEFLAVKRA